MYTYVYVSVLMNVDIWVDWKRVSDPKELELQAIVSHPVWMQGVEPGSSERVVLALNLWASSPAPIWLPIQKNEHLNLCIYTNFSLYKLFLSLLFFIFYFHIDFSYEIFKSEF